MAINPSVSQKRLGKVIREKRTLQGHSQESFAGKCGVHRTYMGAIERGERNISLMNIIKIATALKLKPSDLFALAKL